MKTLVRIVLASVLVVGAAAPGAAQSDRERARAAAERARENANQQRQAQQQRAREAAAREREAAQERARKAREAAQARTARNWPEVTEVFSQAVRLGRNGTFELQNLAGTIVVSGGGGDEVRIQATKRARYPQESSARAALQALQIQVVERGGNVQVRTDHPRGRNSVTSVDYTVTVPNGANVVLGTLSGDVRISNVAGEIRANSVSGNLTTSAVRRVRQLTTVSGNVEIADAEADELEASSVDGNIVLRGVKGRVLELSTVTGDAQLLDVELDRATLQSMAGDLTYSGRLSRSGRYEFQTHSGDIRVSPSGDQGFDLDAATYSGNVRSDFALKATSVSTRGPQRTLRGSFGNAGAIVSAQSFAGDILIVRR
jgi:DUF4097 and DUF4098 domain-containing protein YvlB